MKYIFFYILHDNTKKKKKMLIYFKSIRMHLFPHFVRKRKKKKTDNIFNHVILHDKLYTLKIAKQHTNMLFILENRE